MRQYILYLALCDRKNERGVLESDLLVADNKGYGHVNQINSTGASPQVLQPLLPTTNNQVSSHKIMIQLPQQYMLEAAIMKFICPIAQIDCNWNPVKWIYN